MPQNKAPKANTNKGIKIHKPESFILSKFKFEFLKITMEKF